MSLMFTNSNPPLFKFESYSTDSIASLFFMPFFEHTISAGFPSPADDYCQKKLDLNELLIHKRSCTLFITVNDNTLSQYGIYPDDLLIVDQSRTPKHKDVVLLRYLRNEYIRLFYKKNGKCLFVAQEQGKTAEFIETPTDNDIEIIGVAVARVHCFKV